jgi:hypothetical protein
LSADTDLKVARNLAMSGYQIAMESHQGPTVRLIGACCRVISIQWGDSWENSSAVLHELEQQLPEAKPYIDILQHNTANSNLKPLQLLTEVLPFNFH